MGYKQREQGNTKKIKTDNDDDDAVVRNVPRETRRPISGTTASSSTTATAKRTTSPTNQTFPPIMSSIPWNSNNSNNNNNTWMPVKKNLTWTERFWNVYVWRGLGFLTIGLQVTAIALDPKSSIVYIMATISIPLCVYSIARTSKVKHWKVLYKQYEQIKTVRSKLAAKQTSLVSQQSRLTKQCTKLQRKEKKIKKILKQPPNNGAAEEEGPNTTTLLKKLYRLSKRQKKVKEQQRKHIYEEILYQALSASISMMMSPSSSSSKQSSSNKKKKNHKQSKNVPTQQLNYFLEMMQDIRQIQFQKQAFLEMIENHNDNHYHPPMDLILRKDIFGSEDGIFVLNEDEWYPHSNAIFQRLVASPYSSFALGKQIILTKEEEAIATRFRKMISLGVPKEAARKKMQMEHTTPKIIASVLEEEWNEEENDEEAKKKKKTKAVFHWDPLYEPNKNNNNDNDNDDHDKDSKKKKSSQQQNKKKEQEDERPTKTVMENSIWTKTAKRLDAKKKDPIISKHIASYTKKQSNKNGDKSGDSTDAAAAAISSSKKDKAGLIDLNRARNIDITLKSFQNFTHEELATIIQYIDPQEQIQGDRLLLLTALVPTATEVKAIQEYGNGPDYRLVQAEKWFRHIVHIKRIEDKTTAIKTMGTFDDIVSFLDSNFTLLTNACQQVMASTKLQDILAMVLQIGNQMNNTNNDDGDDNTLLVSGFTLEFLTQMSYTKGTDKTTTALDLVVAIFMEQNQRETLLLREDILDCTVASDIQISSLIADFGILEAALKQCQQELDLLKKEHKKTAASSSSSRKPPFAAKKSPFGGGGGGGMFDMHKELLAKKLNKIKNTENNAAETETESELGKENKKDNGGGGGGGGMFDMHKELLAKKLQKIHGAQEESSSSPPSQTAEQSEPNAAETVVSSSGGGGNFDMHKELLAKKLGKINGMKGPPATNSSPQKAGTDHKNGSKSNVSPQNGNHHHQLSLDATIHRLETFLEQSKGTIRTLQTKREEASKACKDLSEFFCESAGENSANSLLSILDEFASNLEQSVRKHDIKTGNEAKVKAVKKRAIQKVKLAVGSLNDNLRVISMLRSLRDDAETRGWGLLRDKMAVAAKSKTSNEKEKPSSVPPSWGVIGDMVKNHHKSKKERRRSSRRPMEPEGNRTKDHYK